MRLAQPGGFIRIFVDLDPAIAKLLYQLSQRGVAPEYIGRILAAFPETLDTGEAEQKWSGKVPQAQLIEPLTERELEILQLLNERLTDKEIAQALSISVLTAKTLGMPKLTLGSPAMYRICVQGYLDEEWSDYVQGMAISTERDESQHPITTLTGQFLDQAALYGVLNALYDYHLPLLSVECLSIGPIS